MIEKPTWTQLGGLYTEDFDYISEKANRPVYLNHLEYDMPLRESDVQSTIPK